MYNVCTIMYTHIRSQVSDWNCCVKRLFVCTTVHIPYSTYHVKTNPSQRERERETLLLRYCQSEKIIGKLDTRESYSPPTLRCLVN